MNGPLGEIAITKSPISEPALHINVLIGTIDVSQDGLAQILTWASANRPELILVLLFFSWWIWQARIGKRERNAQKLEFDDERRKVPKGGKSPAKGKP